MSLKAIFYMHNRSVTQANSAQAAMQLIAFIDRAIHYVPMGVAMTTPFDLHIHTTIDMNFLARDVGRLRAGHKGYRMRNIGRLAQMAQRN
jgi:hypothetical protein